MAGDWRQIPLSPSLLIVLNPNHRCQKSALPSRSFVKAFCSDNYKRCSQGTSADNTRSLQLCSLLESRTSNRARLRPRCEMSSLNSNTSRSTCLVTAVYCGQDSWNSIAVVESCRDSSGNDAVSCVQMGGGPGQGTSISCQGNSGDLNAGARGRGNRR